ncbi:MAG TPA: acyl-CoA dehydrogenase [Casimicrobiaceae bacterium]|nr:acyl-CoA dehydrogenase [Casimicrobiaceae bacterium]
MPILLVVLIAAVVLFFAAPLTIPPLRHALVSAPLFALFRKVMPPMSQTEREAIEAGTVWWDAELFTGRPNWKKLIDMPAAALTAEEQRFLDEDVEELCAMVTDWETTNVYRDLPPHVWQFIRERGFLGMIIPKAYGGLGFSAFAHSEVITKLATRSGTVVVTVMVPNSLGPGELLLRYGTDEQKQHYLPRLAKGLELPCFALTNPYAGSDAAAIPDTGIVCWGEHEGQRVLGLRLTWEKRYITLGPVATLLGLAFRALDPDHLVGDVDDIGITCALIPTSHPGVHIGRRHMPLNAVFQNGPNWGHDVFIPLDWVIGGQPMLGKGWRMLMECLAAGRSISLPSSSTGMAKLAVRATGGYARVRTQFHVPIARFEGVEEPLARMAGTLYCMDAVRRVTAAAVDQGEKPAVLSAVSKYHITERAREVINDAMDIAGGKGICMGPSNFLGAAYMQMPVSITVEGANILTRSLIIFGQGAIRAHPFVLKEIESARDTDERRGLATFEAALFGHVRFAMSNFARTFVAGITGSHFIGVHEGVAPETRRYYQRITRFASALAFLADVSMGTLGGALKRRESLSARLGDVLSMLYLASATLKRYEAEGRQAEDAPLMHWAVRDAMFKAQTALEGVITNFPNRFVAGLFRFVTFPLGRPYSVPSDALGHAVASLVVAPTAARDRLTAGMFLPKTDDDPVGLIEHALAATLESEPVDAKVRAAVKAGTIAAQGAAGEPADAVLARAEAAGVINAAEHALVRRQRVLAARVVRVDDFAQDLGAAEMEPPHPVTPHDADVAQSPPRIRAVA